MFFFILLRAPGCRLTVSMVHKESCLARTTTRGSWGEGEEDEYTQAVHGGRRFARVNTQLRTITESVFTKQIDRAEQER